MSRDAGFGSLLASWALEPDGLPLHTHSSDLLPVRTRDGMPAMLKLPHDADERSGAMLMSWWNGHGAAPVLNVATNGALLLERAMGRRSLAHWARSGQDDDATRVLCQAAATLHEPRAAAPPAALVPLDVWFRELGPVARTHGGVLGSAWEIARTLLAAMHDVVPLHGDLHHDNVLDFGVERGWLAIDPKGLLGERGFDYANIFSNPQTAGVVVSDVALLPGVLERRLEIVADAAKFEPDRLLQWIVAYCGLSAAWTINDGDDASLCLGVASKAVALQGKHG